MGRTAKTVCFDFIFMFLFISMSILFVSLPFISPVDVLAANKYPSPTGTFFVNDFAGVLSRDTEDRIAQLGKQLEDKTGGAQVVVVTIQTLDGQDIDSYANELFDEWGIGQKGKDNGVLILDAVNERMLRIEVGYGLEGAVTDIETANIRQKYMNPYLKNNDYDNGIYNGYAAVVEKVAQEYGVDAGSGLDQKLIDETAQQPGETTQEPYENAVPAAGRSGGINFVPFIVIIFLAIDGIFFRFRITAMLIRIFFWSSLFRGGRGGCGGSGRGGGGFGGGGSRGGGGRSGGGGSSGGY